MSDDQKTPADPDDATEAGDTPEHSSGDASDEHGGTGKPSDDLNQPGRDPSGPPPGRYKRGTIGGEGEGESAIDAP